MKNKIIKHSLYTLATLLLLGVFSSCKKSLLEKSPITELSGDVIKTESDFTALLNSAYDPIQWQVYKLF